MQQVFVVNRSPYRGPNRDYTVLGRHRNFNSKVDEETTLHNLTKSVEALIKPISYKLDIESIILAVSNCRDEEAI